MSTAEEKRLNDQVRTPLLPWGKWGPYVAERSWGTVREDYSHNGDAWNYFPFDDANSRTYRWGEDGIAGWCDRFQVLVFAPAFWNKKDPFLKERLFGLASAEGNHGEDVKEHYFYLDGTPTHSYMKFLYKYPQEEFPYKLLKDENRHRSPNMSEYELIDTGIFADNRYFDIFIEYAKESEEDTCIRIEAFNRAKEDAPLYIIPQLWFRNQWAWRDERQPEPNISKGPKNKETCCIIADDSNMIPTPNLDFDYRLGKRYLYGPANCSCLFTNNESPHFPNQTYFKNGFHRKIVNGENTVNPKEIGTKACFAYYFEKVPAGGSVVLHLRLTDRELSNPLADVEKIISQRKKEADEFYETVHPKKATQEEKALQRQALAGMLWSKQFYYYDVNLWLEGDNTKMLPPSSRLYSRNQHWHHLNTMRILLMPDKWEYPWFAAWDLAFHTLTMGLIDIEFAKNQLWVLLFDQFLHPNGQIPAYEWDFSDLNPPVQAWAAWRLYSMEKEKSGKGDTLFLKNCFGKLLINFTWWVNRVDSDGNNVFEGGFLGLDNITIVDRSQKTGMSLNQSDGTGWMALYALYMMQIALELAKEDPFYESLATKFFQHFVYIAHAMKKRGNVHYELWSERDGFFYDVLSMPDGSFNKFRVRSLVGLIPLFAVDVIREDDLVQLPNFYRSFKWFMNHRKHLVKDCVFTNNHNGEAKYLFSLVDENHLSRVLSYVWNPDEFRSEFGLRSLSKFHEKQPFGFMGDSVGYEPGESLHRIKGGNSNWRGPIWFPTSYLLIEALGLYHEFFGDKVKITAPNEDPVGLQEIAASFAKRQIAIFLNDANGVRPFWGEDFIFAKDPHWKDYILFNEYFHADTGKGLGSSHQSGWTALVANLISEFRK